MRPPTGVRRGRPVRRPVVSSRAWPGRWPTRCRIRGLATWRWYHVTRRRRNDAATFAAVAAPAAATLLRAVVAEAQTDSATAELLSAFVHDRRGILHGILRRALARGELAADIDLELLIDQVYGVLWYRLADSILR